MSCRCRSADAKISQTNPALEPGRAGSGASASAQFQSIGSALKTLFGRNQSVSGAGAHEPKRSPSWKAPPDVPGGRKYDLEEAPLRPGGTKTCWAASIGWA